MAYFRTGGGGTDTSDADAVASDIKLNKTAYVNDVKVTGTFEGQTKAVTASRSAQTVTPDSGKYLSEVTVNKYPDATGTYTYPANSTGGTYDMGATNNLRYVNASNVYDKGKIDGNFNWQSAQIPSTLHQLLTVNLGYKPTQFVGYVSNPSSGMASAMVLIRDGNTIITLAGGSVFTLTDTGFTINADNWHNGRTFYYLAKR